MGFRFHLLSWKGEMNYRSISRSMSQFNGKRTQKWKILPMYLVTKLFFRTWTSLFSFYPAHFGNFRSVEQRIEKVAWSNLCSLGRESKMKVFQGSQGAHYFILQLSCTSSNWPSFPHSTQGYWGWFVRCSCPCSKHDDHFLKTNKMFSLFVVLSDQCNASFRMIV